MSLPRMIPLLFLVALVAGCGDKNPIPPPPKKPVQADVAVMAAVKEVDGSLDSNADPEILKDVRESTANYAMSAMPQWKIKGISSFSYSDNVFLMGVDVTLGKKRKTVNLLARRFVSLDSTAYWKTDRLNPAIEKVLMGDFHQKYKSAEADNEDIQAKTDNDNRQDDSDSGDEGN